MEKLSATYIADF